jgi:hypothetical protein
MLLILTLYRLTFNRLISYSKRIPPSRSICYPLLRTSLVNIASLIPSLDTLLREELSLPEYTFEYPTEEMTEEELEKMKEEAEARKAEWLKKNKKKPKSEEEEKADMEELTLKIIERVREKVVGEDEVMGVVEEKVEMLRLQTLINEHTVMDYKKWDEMYRKKSILDIG